jgi:uncharacterized protein YjbI with pentapeptide repeats
VTERLDYSRSCARLRELGLLEEDADPPIPTRMPRCDDEGPLGVSFFRTEVSGDFSNLTLPRCFASRSLFDGANFSNSDLSQSNFCWNDFEGCQFSRAVLAGADLRASLFTRVRFDGADLNACDLRRSTFEACDFGAATMKGAVLTHAQGEGLQLSSAQRAQIAWTDDDGPEPDGG